MGDDNYASWSKAMWMWLVSRRKLGFIDGKITKPEDTIGEEFEAWEMVNGLVYSWITHSLEKHIASMIVYIDLASVAWKDLEEGFNQGNGPLLYQLRYELYNLHQGNDSVSTYLNKMKTLWDNLDANQPTHMHMWALHLWSDQSNPRRKRENKSNPILVRSGGELSGNLRPVSFHARSTKLR